MFWRFILLFGILSSWKTVVKGVFTTQGRVFPLIFLSGCLGLIKTLLFYLTFMVRVSYLQRSMPCMSCYSLMYVCTVHCLPSSKQYDSPVLNPLYVSAVRLQKAAWYGRKGISRKYTKGTSPFTFKVCVALYPTLLYN